MSHPEDIRRALERAEQGFKDGVVAGASIDLTRFYVRQKIGSGAATPLPDGAIRALGLVEMTTDPRWKARFLGNPKLLGLYRSTVGCYWLLRFEGGMGEHWLDQVGTAAAAEERFGAG